VPVRTWTWLSSIFFMPVPIPQERDKTLQILTRQASAHVATPLQ
jgi:hypothetical protein